MTLRVTWAQALAWRMERQLIEPLGALSAVEVVRRLCGVQAQVASSADLAVRVRQANPRTDEVREALGAGLLVKTWANRGTLHLLPADEAGAYLALVAHGRWWQSAAWERYFGLSAAQMERLRDVVRDILDGKVLTREDVNAEIIKRPGYEHLADELKSGWGTLFKPLAYQGDIVFGPSRGTRVTFARPEQMTKHWQPLPDVDHAAPLVISNYLAAYGQASPTQVKAWLARGRVAAKQLRHWFALLGDSLTRVEVDGDEMFVRAEDIDALAAAQPNRAVRLLGGFDQWVLGPGTDDPHVIPSGRRTAVSRTAGWIAPLVVVGGVVCATWSLNADHVTVEWFRESGKPPAAALKKEVERLSGLVGRSLDFDVVLVD
jgi:Winged helix DNA-binding domain